MCNSNFSSARYNLAGHLLGDKFKHVDPLGAKLERVEKKEFAKEALPPPPPALQEQKLPDTIGMKARPRAKGTSTLLTGGQGLSAGTINSGGSTLLGG